MPSMGEGKDNKEMGECATNEVEDGASCSQVATWPLRCSAGREPGCLVPCGA